LNLPFNSETKMVVYVGGFRGKPYCWSPWFSNRTKIPIVKSPKLYLTDTGYLCALLNIRSKGRPSHHRQSGAVWETFLFRSTPRPRTQRRTHWKASSFGATRTREVDSWWMPAGRLGCLKRSGQSCPNMGDTVNLDFVRNVFGQLAYDRPVRSGPNTE